MRFSVHTAAEILRQCPLSVISGHSQCNRNAHFTPKADIPQLCPVSHVASVGTGNDLSGPSKRTREKILRKNWHSTAIGAVVDVTHKRTFVVQSRCLLYPESGHWSAPSTAFLALQVWSLDARDRLKPAIRLSRKDWASAGGQSGLCPVRGADCTALRDPAPPACSLWWGFGGGGDGRCTTEGDPMTKANSKRKTALHADDSKTKTRNSVRRTTACRS